MNYREVHVERELEGDACIGELGGNIEGENEAIWNIEERLG